ncbi:helix-turn-helix transcriptional regulator [Kitasatospora sp. NPDC058218]|uniref:helix-turn-helix transcriptional regulator n=1 Tax=Kitasatospora sp. NPDC058218 TaxID=3346385 RepID=UPI0036DF284C
MALEESARTGWTFVTNHARVLAAIARDPGVRLRDVAVEVQLTERAVQAIVTDLEQAGYLTRSRTGRRNRYRITSGTWLRHPAESGLSVAALLDLLAPSHTHAAENPDGDGGGARDGNGHDHAPEPGRTLPQRSGHHAER